MSQAHAFVDGIRHEVRITRDLTHNWSIELYPTPREGLEKRAEPYKNWPVPICLKIWANSKESALEGGLNHLKQLDQIENFVIERDDSAQ